MNPILKIHFVKEQLRKRVFRGLRKIQKDYQFVKNNELMGGVTQTVHAINQSQYIHNGIFKKSVFGAAIKDPEIVFRQFLFSNQIAHKINESLIKASADPCDKFKYPIPKLWRKALKEQGFKVAELHSAFLFQKLVCMRFLFGVFSILINLFKGVKEIILPRNKFLGEFVFFCGLTENNLPHPDKNAKVMISFPGI